MNICILRLTALGDCINAFGLVQALEAKNKDDKIFFIVDKKFSSIFKDKDGHFLANIIEFDSSKGKYQAIVDLKAKLKDINFHILFNLQTSIKASLISLFCIKSQNSFGYDKQRSREGQRFFVKHTIEPIKSPHVLDGFLAFAKVLGYDNLLPRFDFKISFKEREQMLKKFEHYKIFLLSPLSSKSYKNWTFDGYVQICKYAQSKGFCVALVGDSSQHAQEYCSRLEKALDFKVVNLCAKTSLRDLLVLVSISSLTLSPDSAIIHICSALNKPVISLYAIHSPQRVGAYNFKDLYVSVFEQCAKAQSHGKKIPWRYRIKDKKAMELISYKSVQEVFDKAIEKYKL